MTDAEIDALSGVELARAVAVAFGWRLIVATDPRGESSWVKDLPTGGCQWMDTLSGFRPDRDIVQAWELQASVERESQREGKLWWEWPSPLARYTDALCHICGVTYDAEDVAEWYDGWQMTYKGMWALIHATPEQRCRAYLKARGKEPL